MRIVCLSDTHGLHDGISIPDGDVLIHAGDFCNSGIERDVHKFARWLRSLPHRHKIVIAGNHDRFLQQQPDLGAAYFVDAVYLQDSGIEIEGVRFWGSPWQPEFGRWAFGLPRGEPIRKKWDLIPEGTDVLVTHCPPQGILDEVQARKIETAWGPAEVEGTGPLGCEELSLRLLTIRPKIHVFGHVHDGAGQITRDGTLYVNASICDEEYRVINRPVIVEA